MPEPETVADWAHRLTSASIAAAIAVGLAIAAHFALFAVLSRVTKASPTPVDDTVFQRLREPLRWSLIAIAISLAAESQPTLAHIWDSVARFVVPALMGWVVYSLVKGAAATIIRRAESDPDELVARSRRTRAAILSRTAGFIIVLITVSLMLLGIPGVRNVGVTLMASAGLIGLAVGAAAQPALKSLIAGIQMALTEPIRIGDLVVIEGETGRVEDIRMSYVVVRTNDERRLIVPMTKFLETTFQNWTRVAGGITGSVSLPVRPGTEIAPIRQAFERILASCPEWDRRTGIMQVVEVRKDAVELKLVMSAADPTALAALRLGMREAMHEWLRVDMADALCQPEE